MALVLISTAEDPVPVIIERPETFPFQPGERDLWREATDEEYSRYYEHYTGGPGDPEGPWRTEEDMKAASRNFGFSEEEKRAEDWHSEETR